MQNIKKNSIVFIVFLTLSTSLFGLNKNIFNMKTSAEFGLLNGYVKEYVFSDLSKNKDNMVSRLNWDVLAIPYFEADISFYLFKYLYLNLNGRIGLPVYSGVMQDYDWLNSTPPDGYSHWTKEDPNELTNYSKHNNQVDMYYNWSIKLGGNIIPNKKIILSPYIGFRNSYFDFLATDGYTVYKWNDFDKHPLPKGKGIRYRHINNAFILGLQFDFNFSRNWSFNTYIQAVPGLVNLKAIDIHYLTSTAYLDEFKTFFELEWKGTILYNLGKHHKLGFTAYIDYMPLVKGISGFAPYEKNKDPTTFNKLQTSEGGTDKFLFSFALMYQFKL